jgi:hypothetical protein
VTEEAASILRRYGVFEVAIDHFGEEFVREPLRQRGISPIVSEQRASDLYLAFLPSLNSGFFGLLDHARQRTQLCQLERKTGVGRDRIDHPRNQHDDLINAGALALVTALKDKSPALMHRRHFLTADGQAVPDPVGWPLLFSVLVVGQDGTAAIPYFALNPGVRLGVARPSLVLADIEVSPLSVDTIDGMQRHLAALHRELRIGVLSWAWVQPEMMASVHLRGLVAEPIPGEVLLDQRLGLGVAGQVVDGLVKMSARAYGKMAQLPLGASLTFRGVDALERDPLRHALAIGIALGLNPEIGASVPVPTARRRGMPWR